MRPIYETAADRQREGSVWDYITSKYHCTYERTPDLSCIDGLLRNPAGELMAFVEIKTRTNAHDKYPTYMLSARKWYAALELSEKHEVPTLLVVKFTDGVYCTGLRKDYEVYAGGRYDRNDSLDIEDCIYIPMSEFKAM